MLHYVKYDYFNRVFEKINGHNFDLNENKCIKSISIVKNNKSILNFMIPQQSKGNHYFD
jgi:hypothetical protein